MKNVIFLFLILLISCKQEPSSKVATWTPYDESTELAENATHESVRLRYKLLQSQHLDKNDLWDIVSPQLSNFTEEDYETLKPLILNKDILTIQYYVTSGRLTYEKITQWYLYRIVKFENDSSLYLNAIIALNPNAVEEARARDINKLESRHPIYGMPILLKDNINAAGMNTTAGAVVFKDNACEDAFIVEKIKENGGIILGKSNLSEWANFLFNGGPNGFSSIGGQTLNPYGRKIFDTGGSSSGSGAAIAANYAAAAVGTETSGSILSPSSKNSLVGLKPTTGRLSRTGIVPLSSTFDTPGPMTRNVMDNAILLSAMSGEDPDDKASVNNPAISLYWDDLEFGSLAGLRLGVNRRMLRDSIYKESVEKLKSFGAITIEFDYPDINSDGFSALLRADMNIDLSAYIDKYFATDFPYRSVTDILAFNLQDSVARIPYGQDRLAAVTLEDLDEETMSEMRVALRKEGKRFFEEPMTEFNLDAILSTNNSSARNAAMANYPCLTLPMGYRTSGEPCNLTFIAPSFQEEKLLKMAWAFEKATQIRKQPADYN